MKWLHRVKIFDALTIGFMAICALVPISMISQNIAQDIKNVPINSLLANGVQALLSTIIASILGYIMGGHCGALIGCVSPYAC